MSREKVAGGTKRRTAESKRRKGRKYLKYTILGAGTLAVIVQAISGELVIGSAMLFGLFAYLLMTNNPGEIR